MKTILFYGNCQLGALRDIIKKSEFKMSFIACHSTRLDENRFLSKIQDADIIITQPISDNYREKPHLSTKYLVENVKPCTKIIVFPSMRGDFYYPDIKRTIDTNGNDLGGHYRNLINYYISGNTSDEFIRDVVNNIDFMTEEEINNYADYVIKSMVTKENEILERFSEISLIRVSDYIKENWRETLLFFTVNHATKFIYHFLAEELKKKLTDDNIKINYKREPQYGEASIIYSCLSKVLKFDIQDVSVWDKYNCKGTDEIVNLWFEIYNKEQYNFDLNNLTKG